MGDLALSVQNVDGHENHAQLDARQVEVDHLQAVGEVYAKAIAGFESALFEQVGDAGAALVDLAEGQRAALELKRDCVPAFDEGEIKQIGEIHLNGYGKL